MAGIGQLKEKVKREVDKLRDRCIEMADYIFDNPELGLKEYKTKEYLINELKNNGFSCDCAEQAWKRPLR